MNLQRDEFEAAYIKIKSMAKSFHKYVPLPNGDDLEYEGADSLGTLWSMGFFPVSHIVQDESMRLISH